MQDTYIKIQGISGSVRVCFSQRKSLGIQVAGDGSVTVRAPMGLSMYQIRSFLLKKKGWIEKHVQEGLENTRKLKDIPPFTEDDIRQMMRKAEAVIPERTAYYAAMLGVTYGRITIRCQKTKWGSCSAKGNLNFNCLLVKTPPEILDSVVVHELCHRRYMDHSKEFYAEVYRVFPDYDRCSRWLKENGGLLIRRAAGDLTRK